MEANGEGNVIDGGKGDPLDAQQQLLSPLKSEAIRMLGNAVRGT